MFNLFFARALAQERVRPSLLADRRRRTMPWIDLGRAREGKEPLTNGPLKRVIVSAWKIGSPNRPRKKGVADEEAFVHMKGNAPWGMARCLDDRDRDRLLTELKDLTLLEVPIQFRDFGGRKAENRRLSRQALKEEEVTSVHVERRSSRSLDFCHCSHVINVPMSVEDVANFELMLPDHV